MVEKAHEIRPASAAAEWARQHETDQLISAKSFDFRRTARSCLEVALRLASADGGVLATFDRGQDLVVLAAQGVDEEGVLEDPRLRPLYAEALEQGEVLQRELRAGPALPRAGRPTTAVVAPLLLRIRPVDEGELVRPQGIDRERRRHGPLSLKKPLGVLLLACPPGELDADRRRALAAFADHACGVLTSARLYHMATHDPLTDLYRRPELEQHLQAELTIARHSGRPLSLLMFDIDDLGKVNQVHSRARGDKVIARVARLIRAQVRGGDACIRYGGEEFVVVLPGTDAEGALVTAEKIRAQVAAYAGFGSGLDVRISGGVASFPEHAESAAELLRKVDQTLFISKQDGGDKVLLWHRRIPKHALRSDKLIGIITGNLNKDYRNVMLLLDTIVVVNSLLERQQVLSTLMDMLIQLSGCERGVLFLEREGRLTVELSLDGARQRLDADDVCMELVERVRHHGLPIAVRADEEDAEEGLAEACRRRGLSRMLALPLAVKGKQIGCMYFDAPPPGGRPAELEEADLIFMQALARELGNALEKARLYQENLEQKKELEELTARLAQKVQAQATELADLERNLSQFKSRFDYEKIVGKSEPMQKVFKLLDRITDTDVPVLIQGETGTGKELVARALHLNGPRRDGPFVSVNCSAISESLMESELFGHTKGAFTGADRDKPGFFEQAHRGTIFLDEVQDMSPAMQRELLRVLQEGEVRRVGGKDIIHVDVRVVSASNRDLRDLVPAGVFRQDLFYRLNVVSIELPPLRDRKEDIPLIVQRLLEETRTPDGRRVRLAKEALRAILRYDWPGNVRQLQNFIEKTVLLIEGDTIHAEHVRLDGDAQARGGVSRMFELDYNEAKSAFAREYLKAVLARNGGNVTRAATEAGIVRSSFHKMMRKHGIAAKDFNSSRSVTGE